MHISVGIKEFLQVLLLFREKVVWRASVMQELNVSGWGEWRTSSGGAHIFLSLGAPRLKLPGGSRAQSIKMQRKKPRETSEDKQQSGDLFSKSDQIYFVSFVYLVSLSSLGFYKTQMLSSLNRLTSWKSECAQIKILIIMIMIIIRDPTYLKNIL